jgi:hypothetical protein
MVFYGHEGHFLLSSPYRIIQYFFDDGKVDELFYKCFSRRECLPHKNRHAGRGTKV